MIGQQTDCKCISGNPTWQNKMSTANLFTDISPENVKNNIKSLAEVAAGQPLETRCLSSMTSIAQGKYLKTFIRNGELCLFYKDTMALLRES